ncbi:hypothetical protein LOD99_1636 [Oopsacas minuta]|uniref:NADH dehydrogenase [ubiquinone] iron-sulfur protein 4, mitochondrial n=1 Tax=Oopsacas minuta TaxID=111878 RepID=A0AAV7K3T7_9METZ|nr:hypothetical protein LOD99_1636 [Oopsacas minuta]
MAYRLLLRNITNIKPIYSPILPALQTKFYFSEKSVIPLTETITLDTPVSLKELNGLPPNHVSRYVVISKPARCTMQSGTEGTHNWRIEFETQQRWENPVMGWASTGDPLSNMVLDFSSKEAAMNFAVENGWKYKVKEPAVVLPRKKSYAANFSWNKKTRVTNK